MLEFMMLVLINPGSMITTLIPKGSNSYDSDSLKPSNANFVLWYAYKTGTPIRPPTEHTFTIVPPLLCFLMKGITFCVTRITQKKFGSNCAFISSIDTSSSDQKTHILRRYQQSTPLFSSSILPIASLTDLSSLTSSWTISNGSFSLLAFCHVLGFFNVAYRRIGVKSTFGQQEGCFVPYGAWATCYNCSISFLHFDIDYKVYTNWLAIGNDNFAWHLW